MRIAHIVKPMIAAPGSEHAIAQPITFASMRAAAAQAKRNGIDVELWTAYLPEDEPAVPPDFRKAPVLRRAVGDLRTFRIRRPLPLFRDVLDAICKSTDAEYVIYTNVDIGLQPHFYAAVRDLIAEGHDAFVINRRTISDRYRSPGDLPAMYAEEGAPHPGYDCFVFRRDLYPRFVIGDVCLGNGHVDTPLVCSMIATAKNFVEIADARLTFHQGDSLGWWKWKYRDYILFNDRQAAKALLELARREGFLSKIRPHMRLLVAIPLLKNSLIVSEWQRIAAMLRRA